jgi:hypothetical protein
VGLGELRSCKFALKRTLLLSFGDAASRLLLNPVRSIEKPRHPLAFSFDVADKAAVMLRPVEPGIRLEPASEFRLYAHASIISFKDDTFPPKRLRLPDVSSRLKVLQYSR